MHSMTQPCALGGPNYSLSKRSKPLGPLDPAAALGLRCKQKYCRPYLQYPIVINMLFPSCSRTRTISLEKRAPDVNDLVTRSQAANEKNLRLVPDLNHARPYSTFRWKSSTFHDLAPILFMFFQSRIDATHACIIGHTVYRKHVRSSPGVHSM
jgi:hypothetical protein